MTYPSSCRAITRVEILFSLVFIAVVLFLAFGFIKERKQASLEKRFPVISQVRSFQLTNQAGESVAYEKDLKGVVWVADVIFTRCAGPCPKITRNLAKVQKRLAGTEGVRFVSLTSDPGYDTPEELFKFGRKLGVRFDNWDFLTGDRKEIYRLATEDLKMLVAEKEEDKRIDENDLFLHSVKFILVDRQGRVRGAYDGTAPETEEQLTEDIRALLN